MCLKRFINKLFFIILLFNFSFLSAAPPNLIFQHLDLDLPVPNAMLQDHQGFIWIGSDVGLYRFDGYKLLNFSSNVLNEFSLPHNRVMSLAEDSQHRLWVGTADGLVLFNRKTHQFKQYLPPVNTATKSKKNRYITEIILDKDKGLWLATREGLQYFNFKTEQFHIYLHDANNPESIHNNNVDTIFMDQQRGLWIATWPKGVDYLPAGSEKFQHYQINTILDSPLEKNVRALFVDQQQRIWLGTEAGIFMLDANQTIASWKNMSQKKVEGMTHNFRVQQFAQDQKGTIWATSMIGLLRWNESTAYFESYTYEANNIHSIAENYTYGLLFDKSHSLWIANGKGLDKIDLALLGFENIFPKNLSGSNKKTRNEVKSIDYAKDNNFWLMSSNSILLIDVVNKQIIKQFDNDFLRANVNFNLYSIYYDKFDDILWLGTNNGLFNIDLQENKIKRMFFSENNAINFINRIKPSLHNTLWLATGAGLFEYDIKNNKVKDFKDDIFKGSVTTLFVDSRDNVWFSDGNMTGGGINVFNSKSETINHYNFNIKDKKSLGGDHIKCIVEDKKGRVWLVSEKGLSVAYINPDKTFNFNNISYHNIASMVVDKQGYIWLNTLKDVVRFNPDLFEFKKITLPDAFDFGFYINDFLRINNKLYFNHATGIVEINADTIADNNVKPDVSITDIKLSNKSIAGTDQEDIKLIGAITNPEKLILPWGNLMLSLHFSALHFTNPKLNQYAYKLEGFDKDWINTSYDNRVATYTNLNPGHYIFHVKASNNTGIWNEEGISFSIEIIPPYWKTIWFKVVLISSIIIMLIFLYFIRIWRLKNIQKNLEQQVKNRTHELEKMHEKSLAAVKVKSAFLANMSHEIRTPMNAIIGMQYLALQSNLTTKQHNYIYKANISAKWLLGIINDILDFSKLEAGKLKLEHKEFVFEDIIYYLQDVSTTLIGDKAINLIFEIDESIPKKLTGDSLRLGQILLNLISNAIKFTEKGLVSLKVKLITSNEHEVQLYFYVNDSGIGISESQQKKLFQSFEQANSSTTRLYGGTGLGLTIARQLIQMMGSEIELSSELEKGSCFSFSLNLKIAEAEKLGAISPATPLKITNTINWKAINILLVEDSFINQEVMIEIFNQKGIVNIDVANNGREALAILLKPNNYQLVLMDCLMPIMDGYEATSKIRALPQYANLPIIALTANIMPEDKQHCLDAGMNAHIGKPIDPDSLLPALAVWLK